MSESAGSSNATSEMGPFRSNGCRTTLLDREPSQAHLAQALERIQNLEAALERSQAMLTKAQESLYGIYTSSGWKILTRYYALRNFIYPRYCSLRNFVLPKDSRRRWLVSQLRTASTQLGQVLARVTHRPRLRSINAGYPRWIERHEPSSEDLRRQQTTLLRPAPLISLLVAMDNPRLGALEAMIRSVQAQTYGHWELCLAGARSAKADETLRSLAQSDCRLQVEDDGNGALSAGVWAAVLARSRGDYVALLAQADTLAPFALFEIVRALNADPDADVLYSDEDHLQGDAGGRRDPLFKPEWSPDTLFSHHYLGHLLVLRRTLVAAVGGFRPGYEGAEDYDLALRATARARRIVHVPQILYHVREQSEAVSWSDAGARRALQAQLDGTGVNAEVRPGLCGGTWEVRYRHARRPLVSVIIPNRDYADGLSQCVESIRLSTYTPYEIILVENHSVRAETFACYQRLQEDARVRLLTWERPFNYAAINNFATTQARGEVLLFLNNDMKVINADWLERLLEQALRPEVGAVGAKLYYPDDTVQHAGVVIGLREISGHGHRHFPRKSAGYAKRLVTIQNVSAVTGACLMTRKAVFQEVRGFDEQFALDFNDVDLCLKMQKHGYRIIWTPYAELYHYESKTRGYAVAQAQQVRFMRDTSLFHALWGAEFRNGDPYYSPNLTHDGEDFSLRV